MPWKENKNNEDGPWGDPGQKSNNNAKKKNIFDINNIFENLFLKIKKTFFNGGGPNNNKKSFKYIVDELFLSL